MGEKKADKEIQEDLQGRKTSQPKASQIIKGESGMTDYPLKKEKTTHCHLPRKGGLGERSIESVTERGKNSSARTPRKGESHEIKKLVHESKTGVHSICRGDSRPVKIQIGELNAAGSLQQTEGERGKSKVPLSRLMTRRSIN